MGASQQDPFAETRMSLGDHLEELRGRLIRGVLAVGLSFLVAFFFYQDLSTLFQWPMRRALAWINQDQVEKYEAHLAAHPEEPRSKYFESDDPDDMRLKRDRTVTQRFVATSPSEQFIFALKVSGYAAFFVGAPILLWEMWQFIAAGLYRHERRVIARTVPLSLLLFLSGILFGYFLAVPYGLYFLATAFSVEQVEFLPSLSEYLSLLSVLTLALGLVFQLPLVMHVLVKVDLVQRETFARNRRYFILGAFVLGAMLTPPDPYTQLLLAVPMVLLFELGLLSTRLIKPREPAEAGA